MFFSGFSSLHKNQHFRLNSNLMGAIIVDLLLLKSIVIITIIIKLQARAFYEHVVNMTQLLVKKLFLYQQKLLGFSGQKTLFYLEFLDQKSRTTLPLKS